MYTLIVYYMLSTQWNTDISNTSISQFSSESLCQAGATKVIETLQKMHKYDKIEFVCVRTGAGT